MTAFTLQKLPDPHLPVEVNSLQIDADGSIIRRNQPIEKFNCGFLYEDLPFRVTIHRVGILPKLLLTVDLGFVPYSIESRQQRKTYHQLLQAGQELPIGSLVLKDHQNLTYEIDYPIDPPLTATQIITYITAAILEARPTIAFIKQQLS